MGRGRSKRPFGARAGARLVMTRGPFLVLAHAVGEKLIQI